MSEMFITCLVHNFVHLILDAYKYTEPWIYMYFKIISFKTPDKIFFLSTLYPQYFESNRQNLC